MCTRLRTTEEECNPRVCVVPCAGGGEGDCTYGELLILQAILLDIN